MTLIIFNDYLSSCEGTRQAHPLLYRGWPQCTQQCPEVEKNLGVLRRPIEARNYYDSENSVSFIGIDSTKKNTQIDIMCVLYLYVLDTGLFQKKNFENRGVDPSGRFGRPKKVR